MTIPFIITYQGTFLFNITTVTVKASASNLSSADLDELEVGGEVSHLA